MRQTQLTTRIDLTGWPICCIITTMSASICLQRLFSVSNTQKYTVAQAWFVALCGIFVIGHCQNTNARDMVCYYQRW